MFEHKTTKTGIEFYDNDRFIAKYFFGSDNLRIVDKLTKKQFIELGKVINKN